MKCYFCKKEEIEQGKVLLVNSPDVANAFVFSCDDCSKTNDHAIAKCNDCGTMVDVGSQNKRGGGYIEAVLNENYIPYCKKCAIKMKMDIIEKKYLIKDLKKVFKMLKKMKDCLKFLLILETTYDRIMKKYPYTILCIWKRKKQVVISPFEPDDEIISDINKMLIGE